MTILNVLTNLYNELKRVTDAISNRETISDELAAIANAMEPGEPIGENLDAIAEAITKRETISEELAAIAAAIEPGEPIGENLDAIAEAITKRETISDELTAIQAAIVGRETISDELTAIQAAIVGRETISDELTAIQAAIVGRETISDELTGIYNRLGDVVSGLSCLCNAVRDWSWTGDNPPVQFPEPPPTTILPPPSGGQPSEPGWSACAAAYAMIAALADKFDELADLASTPVWSFLGLLAAIGGIAGYVATGGTVALAVLGAAGLAAALWESLIEIASMGIGGSLRSIAGQLRTNSELRSCMGAAFVDGDGAADKAALIRSAVNRKMENSAYAAVVNSLIDANFVSIFAYGVEVDGVTVYPQHPSPGSCECVDPPDLPPNYIWVEVPYTGVYNLSGSGTVNINPGYMTINATMGQNTAWSGIDVKANVDFPSIDGEIIGMWSNVSMTMSVTRAGGWVGWERWLEVGAPFGRFTGAYAGVVAGTRKFTQFLAYTASGIPGEGQILNEIGAKAKTYTTTSTVPKRTHPLWFQLAYSIDWPQLSLQFQGRSWFLVRVPSS